jgi:hypothetical protein
MKIVKRILIAMALLIILGALGGYIYFKFAFRPPANELIRSSQDHSFPFRWDTTFMNNELNPYSAMLLPVTIPGCTPTFYMQFDLGSPVSLFYLNKLNAIHTRFNNMAVQHQNKKYYLQHYTFQIGAMPVTARQISVRQYDSTGIDWNSNKPVIIGTIGADLIEDKVVLLDYPRQTIYLSDTIPTAIADKVQLSPFTFEQRRLLLPAVIDHKKKNIFFDTGSSAFELLTDESTFSHLSKKGVPVDSFTVNSWNNTLYAFSAPTDYSIQFGTVQIPLNKLTYIKGTAFWQRALMKLSNIGGMTGNKLFVNKLLVLDTKNQRFGIAE